MTVVVDAMPSAAAPNLPDWHRIIDELEQLLDSDARACADRAALALAGAPADPDVEMQLSYFAALAHQIGRASCRERV